MSQRQGSGGGGVGADSQKVFSLNYLTKGINKLSLLAQEISRGA